ncbi:MAG: ArsR family transcriptional regulator [Streptomycetaceae bacterium]|nr:MAG: ArsR family transcriptional regulator [Streptomycetaceae bacterium]
MKESLLLPILRSCVQGDLLALLFLNPEKELTISDAARAIGVSIPGLHHEAVRLIESGFVRERRQGRNRLIRAEVESRIAPSLTDLLALTYGPLPVLERELAGIAGINEAYIFGSWAARYSGVPGAIPNDIDVLVIGSPSLETLNEATGRAEKALIRDVNIARISSKEWSQGSPFIATIKKNPHVRLNL